MTWRISVWAGSGISFDLSSDILPFLAAILDEHSKNIKVRLIKQTQIDYCVVRVDVSPINGRTYNLFQAAYECSRGFYEELLFYVN